MNVSCRCGQWVLKSREKIPGATSRNHTTCSWSLFKTVALFLLLAYLQELAAEKKVCVNRNPALDSQVQHLPLSCLHHPLPEIATYWYTSSLILQTLRAWAMIIEVNEGIPMDFRSGPCTETQLERALHAKGSLPHVVHHFQFYWAFLQLCKKHEHREVWWLEQGPGAHQEQRWEENSGLLYVSLVSHLLNYMDSLSHLLL